MGVEIDVQFPQSAFPAKAGIQCYTIVHETILRDAALPLLRMRGVGVVGGSGDRGGDLWGFARCGLSCLCPAFQRKAGILRRDLEHFRGADIFGLFGACLFEDHIGQMVDGGCGFRDDSGELCQEGCQHILAILFAARDNRHAPGEGTGNAFQRVLAEPQRFMGILCACRGKGQGQRQQGDEGGDAYGLGPVWLIADAGLGTQILVVAALDGLVGTRV